MSEYIPPREDVVKFSSIILQRSAGSISLARSQGEIEEVRKMVLDFKVTRLYKFDGEGATKAFCDVCICDEFLVKGFRIVEGKNGLFVGVPREPGKDGKWYNRAFPLTDSAREALDTAVLSAYEGG